MSPLPELIPASEWYVIYLALPRSLYKVISAGKLNKICHAQPRSASKTAPAYKGSRFEAPSKWYKVKTNSEWRKIKSSSSMCLMCPRLQTPVPGRA